MPTRNTALFIFASLLSSACTTNTAAPGDTTTPTQIEWGDVPVERWGSLQRRYDENPARVHNEWFGKPVQISGTLADIRVLSEGAYRVWMGHPLEATYLVRTIECTPENPDAVLGLAKGESITLRGVGGKWTILGDMSMTECSVRKHEPGEDRSR